MNLKSILHFFIFSNIFIACCALVLTYSTFYLLNIPAALNWYLLLIFLCTLFVYNLHYFIKGWEKSDLRLDWCKRHSRYVVISIFGSAFFILGGIVWHYKAIFIHQGGFNYRNLFWFIIIPFVSLAYSHPLNPWSHKSIREIGLLKSVSLSFVWAFTTVVLPVIMWNDAPATIFNQVLFLFLYQFIFIMSLCVLFNIKDYEEDKKDGVNTVAVMAGPKATLQAGKWVFAVLIAIAGFLLLQSFHLLHTAGFAAILIPLILVFLLFHYFKPGIDSGLFVFLHDGMMIVQALLLIFAVLFINS